MYYKQRYFIVVKNEQNPVIYIESDSKFSPPPHTTSSSNGPRLAMILWWIARTKVVPEADEILFIHPNDVVRGRLQSLFVTQNSTNSLGETEEFRFTKFFSCDFKLCELSSFSLF